MASYNLSFKKSVAKDLRAIPPADIKRILKRIEQLREDPRAEGCLKLSGQERYRTRVGVYRILYEILDQEVLIIVVKIAHRREIYR